MATEVKLFGRWTFDVDVSDISLQVIFYLVLNKTI